MLNRWVGRIDRAIQPRLPYVYDKKGAVVSKPFKKDGSHSKMTTDWYGDDSGVVGWDVLSYCVA